MKNSDFDIDNISVQQYFDKKRLITLRLIINKSEQNQFILFYIIVFFCFT